MQRCTLLILVLLGFAVQMHAQSTALDYGFGNQGKVVVDSPVMMNNNKIALQPDGKIVLAGTYYYYLLPSFDMVYEQRIMRFDPNGSIDTSLNHTGILYKTVERTSFVSALNIQQDGRILVTRNTGYLERYHADGRADSSFNDSAQLYIDYLGVYDNINATALQADGKILIAGKVGQTYLLISRYLSNGRVDTSFGYMGLLTTLLDSTQSCNGAAIAVQPDGKIIVAGSGNGPAPDYERKMVVIRYLQNGAGFDPTFNAGKGYQKFSFPQMKHASANAVQVLADGRIFASGSGYVPQAGSTAYKYYACAAMLTSAGLLDNTFGSDGKLMLDSMENGSPYSENPKVKIQPDGKILMAYYDRTQPGKRSFGLRRYTTAGQPETSFGLDGKITTSLSSQHDVPYDIVLQPDGKILVSGVADKDEAWPAPTHSFAAMVRYLPNPRLSVEQTLDEGIRLSIYPNPTSGQLHVSFQLQEKSTVVAGFTDVTGRLVTAIGSAEASPGVQCHMDLQLPAHLPDGTYLLTLHAGKKQLSRTVLKKN